MNLNRAEPKARRATTRVAGLAALLALAAIDPAGAQGSAPGSRTALPSSGLRVIELAVEATGGDVALPATDIGTASVRSCPGCKPASLLIGSRSRFLLDGQPVSLPVLRAALLGAPQASVVVMHARGSTEITRIIATSPPAMGR